MLNVIRDTHEKFQENSSFNNLKDIPNFLEVKTLCQSCGVMDKYLEQRKTTNTTHYHFNSSCK